MVAWTQPDITSNGTMGGDSFAVAASTTVWTDSSLAYGAFHAGSMWHADNTLPQWIAWYNPYALKIESIRIQNRNSSKGTSDVCAPVTYKLQASDDYNTWIDLTDYTTNSIVDSNLWQNSLVVPEANQAYYKYHRLYITARYSGSSYTAIQSIEITADAVICGQLTHWLGWQQPTSISSNTSYGTISASSYASNCEPYKAVDGVTSTESLGWATDGTAEGWWKWVFPETLRFKRLVFVNRNSDTNDTSVLVQDCQFYTGDKATKMGKAFSVSKSREYVTIDCNDLESNTLYFYKLGGKYSGIGELIIEATTEKTTCFQVMMPRVSEVYTNSKPVVQVYNAGTLIWENSNLDPYTDLEVPVFTDNFTYGVLNSSTSASTAYRALDQVDYSTDSTLDYNCYVSTSAAPQWVMWALPFEVLVKHITFKNNYSADGERTKTAQFFADEAMTIPLTEEFTTVNEDGGVSEFDVSTIKTDTIYCYLKEGYGTNGIVGVGEISIKARKRISASSGLDAELWNKYELSEMISNTSDALAVSTNSPKPTEETIITDWVQPELTANGTLGEDSFAVACTSYYNDSDDHNAYGATKYSTGRWQSNNKKSLPQSLTYYIPEGLNLSSITFNNTNADDGSYAYVFKNYEVFASDDNSTWTSLGSYTNTNKTLDDYTVEITSNDVVYKYYKITVSSAQSASAPCMIGYMRLNGTYSTTSSKSADVYKLFDKDTSEIAWTSDEVENWEEYDSEIVPPYIQMESSHYLSPNGVTICNGDSAIKTFEWQCSNDGSTWTSLGIIQTPSFSWEANSQCNVSIPFSETAYHYHRFIVRSLADDANVVSMKELIPNFYKKNLIPWTVPTITSNTSYGTISAISESTSDTMGAWRVFDGNVYDSSNDTYASNSWRAANGQTLPAYWKWELPITLSLNSITITKGSAGSVYTCQIFSDTDGTNAISPILSFDTSTANASVTYDFSPSVVTNCIYIKILTKNSSSAVALSEISISADEGVD